MTWSRICVGSHSQIEQHASFEGDDQGEGKTGGCGNGTKDSKDVGLGLVFALTNKKL